MPPGRLPMEGFVIVPLGKMPLADLELTGGISVWIWEGYLVLQSEPSAHHCRIQSGMESNVS